MIISDKRILAFTPAIFWLLMLILETLRLIPQNSGVDLVVIIKSVIEESSFQIITFLVFYYIIFPNILKNRKIIISIITGLLLWTLMGFVGIEVYLLFDWMEDTTRLKNMFHKIIISHSLIGTLYAFVLRISVDWVKKNKMQKELEEQNSIIKMALLRSQINPHFLFNTLNNISSFCLNNPRKASFAIKKLSEIMSYMFNEANGEKVLLSKEIGHIENFVSLQKLRFEKVNFVNFKTEGKTDHIYISPMVFLPFIENAFKHGSVTRPDSINILIKINSTEVFLECSNIKKQLTDTEKSYNNGVGLKNIRERLELLYSNKYFLQIDNNEKEYRVKLKIK